MELRRPEFEGATGMMSAADQDGADGALGASRVGAELRAARLRLGWPLPDVAQELADPAALSSKRSRTAASPTCPAPPTPSASCAPTPRSLGLDAAEVARRFRAEAHEVNRKTELTFPAPVPERGVPAGAVVLLGVVLAAGAYAAWYQLLRRPPLRPRRLAGAGASGAARRAQHRRPRRLSPQVASILPPPAPPSATPPPASALPAPLSPPVPTPVPVPVAVPTPAAQTPPPAGPKPDSNRLVLRFKADAYVQVREKQGQVLLNRVMRAGDTWPVPNEPGLVHDHRQCRRHRGRARRRAGGAARRGNGAVRRDVPLEPDAIKMPPGSKPLPASARAQ